MIEIPENSGRLPSKGKPRKIKAPAFRRVRAYAFDPSVSLQKETAGINSLVYKVYWEKLDPGPTGEYVEVIDFDPTTKNFYHSVNLDSDYILAQDGLEPSESNPQFHQQMVYAVAMTTISNFERALGRKVIWAPRRVKGKKYFEYVQRLRIYPHALREPNAYYSPDKKSLLFGYFSSTPVDAVTHMPNALVFTCLSHDIIAHEVTHAILDGMHYFYNDPSNPDVLAFHEAFADIVALFQHFTFPEVLKHQIAQTRGDLESQNLLGKLAQQFGAAIGSYGSLRDAIGEIDDKTREWKLKKPNADLYRTVMEPHERGSILVAAVFEAFINIYKERVADLLRIATQGTGILPKGELQPELVNRLANEAAKSARHVLNMCIRALDYCPPVDITFGEYLRAIITADADLIKDDTRKYRLAFIDAFRRRGIYPDGVRSLSEESLRHSLNPIIDHQTKQIMEVIAKFLSDYREEIIYEEDRRKTYQTSESYIGGRKGLHERIFIKFEDSIEFEKLTGLVFTLNNWQQYGVRSLKSGLGPSYRIQNLRLVSRTGPTGTQLNQIIFSMVQRAGVIVKNNQITTYQPEDDEKKEGGFEFWGGTTMIFDLDSLALKYSISKPLLDPFQLSRGIRQLNLKRVHDQHRFQTDEMLLSMNEHSLYFGQGLNDYLNEPFAFLHKH